MDWKARRGNSLPESPAIAGKDEKNQYETKAGGEGARESNSRFLRPAGSFEEDKV